MNKKRIEKMIPIAMDAINGSGVLDEQRKLHSNYSGYVDSYAPTIMQSGLLSTVAFYAKEPRKKINDEILLKILKGYDSSYEEFETLSQLVNKESTDSVKQRRIYRLLLEAIVSCKLAMRTFPRVKGEEG